MCGIVGCVGDVDVLDRLLGGLEHLEYRGYDSAGVAVGPDDLTVSKRACQVPELDPAAMDGTVGVGHTRWSTHGAPTDANAHPHTDCEGAVAVVHNGVVENHEDLRARLEAEGHEFSSDTDTEVIPHLVERYLATGADPAAALRRAVRTLEGSYAVGMVVEGSDVLYGARNDSPLVVGIDDGVRYLASDVPAFLEHTDQVVTLRDGDVAVLTGDGHEITDVAGRSVDRPARTVDWVPEEARKQGHDHFMRKEIFEQPESVARTLDGRVADDGSIVFEELPDGVFEGVSEVQFVACGTSYHAALYGTQLLMVRGISASATLASEYAHTPRPVDDDTLVVGVTQSGETADTLAAIRAAKQSGARTLALTNTQASTAVRECDHAAFIRSGPEIGVAATKTFSSQMAILNLLADRVAGVGRTAAAVERRQALAALPEDLAAVLQSSTAPSVARRFHGSDAYFFIGRGVAHPVALEGALKLKEISYEHAEGFPAGELKHGPLALVTPDTPVIAVLTGYQDERTLTNVEEVNARGAPVLAVSPRENVEAADVVLSIPDTHPEIAPVLANVQLQLLSYHLADLLGRPIDKPRNLAKSVTVQ